MADTENDCTGRVTLGLVVLVGFGALAYYILVFGMSREIRQEIEGRLSIDGHSATGRKVVLAGEGYHASRKAAVTGLDGSFFIRRRAVLGRVAVVLQIDTLCLFEGGTWQPVWHGSYGPAPHRLRFTCDKSGGNPWRCTLNGSGWETPLESQESEWASCPNHRAARE